jgi:hypothetical protein
MPDEIMTGREALERAFAETREEPAEVVADEPVEAVAETPEGDAPSDDRLRDESGRFKAKDTPDTDPAPLPEPSPIIDAAPVPDDAILPQLNDARAKAAWGTADPVLKAEVGRRIEQLQGGIERYRAEMEPIRRYADMARQSGTTLDAALASYTHIEQTIARNPLEGLDLICRNLGTDIRTVAAQIAGQPAPPRDQEVTQLRQQLHAAQQQLRGHEAAKEQQIAKSLQDFAAEHPRLDELSGSIAWILKNQYMGITTLEAAYAEAERYKPVSPAAAARTSAPEPVAARPGTPSKPVSIKGAPSSGSNPAWSSENLSTRESVQRAWADTR